MKQPLLYIFLLLVSVILVRCSSVKMGSAASKKPVQPVAETKPKTPAAVPLLRDTTAQIIRPDTIALPDSAIVVAETDTTRLPAVTAADSLAAPTDSAKLKIPEKLTAPVFYTAKDSVVFTKGNMGYLYGEADVKYGNLAIKGEYITMNLDSNVVSSTFGIDSLGKEFGHPVFTQGDSEYEMKKVRYNFDTGKAFISNVITQQGEGHIVANTAKKNADNSFYMINAKYTTCDLHSHPHFYLNLSQAKVRPGKNVVTGPAWLVVGDVPLFPVVLPFAFFPFTDKYSSGIIMPSWGDEMQRGFYLQNGGYYFAINDYVDLALTAEIYTKGTWGVNARSTYRKRYKFSGNINGSYLNTVIGDKGLKNIPGQYSVSKDFRINWTHSQDPKANPDRTLSASVNFSTSRANLNDISKLYTRESANNTKSSSVSITQRFPESPWSLSATVNINQVSRDSTISATLPNISATMARIYPFKRKKAAGAERWYEKISMSYSGEFRNSVSSIKESKFFKSSLTKDWQNEISHSIPVSTTFSLFDAIQISPSINYSEKWHTRAYKQAWDPMEKKNVVVDTVSTFKRIYNYSLSLVANTKIYGMYVPWKMFGDKVQAIRHVFSPSVTMSYNPNFQDPKYNFFETYNHKNEYGDDIQYRYSPYQGSTPPGKSGNISFDFKNNIEMKVKSESDSTGFKKISLIDDLGISFGYNMMADSMKWSDIRTKIRLKLSKSYTLDLNATWDPYTYELDKNGNPQRVDKLRIFNGKGFGRLMSAGSSFSYSVNQDTFKKLFGKKEDNEKTEGENQNEQDVNLPDDGTMGRNPYENASRKSVFSEENNSMGEFNEDGYLKNEFQWNLSFNYLVRYGYDQKNFNKERMEYKGLLTHNLGFSGALQPTKNWNFTFSTDYNFDLKKFTSINCTLTRNLHCWSMTASFIPIGPNKSYNFTIRANASMLQDLKWDERNSPYDNIVKWY